MKQIPFSRQTTTLSQLYNIVSSSYKTLREYPAGKRTFNKQLVRIKAQQCVFINKATSGGTALRQ